MGTSRCVCRNVNTSAYEKRGPAVANEEVPIGPINNDRLSWTDLVLLRVQKRTTAKLVRHPSMAVHMRRSLASFEETAALLQGSCASGDARSHCDNSTYTEECVDVYVSGLHYSTAVSRNFRPALRR